VATPLRDRSVTADSSAVAAAEPGLRERQKARRRARILAAGRSQFLDHGYSAANMEAIAAEAEVGVATVYNYFGTKGRLLADILHEDFAGLAAAAGAVAHDPPSDPAAGVLAFMAHYQSFQDNWERKDLLAAVLGPGLSADSELDELALHVESQLKDALKDLLQAYQRSGAIRPDVDVGDAALIIFYIFNQHFIEFILQDAEPFSAMKADMDRQIAFVVKAIRQS
jgi:AcrR family transcriptional regulator